jgi:hypothetical protein
METSSYFGPERRHTPRDSGHSFGTVFVRVNSAWMAREVLILDRNDEAIRIRTLPNLKMHDFRVQLDGEEAIYAGEVKRAEQRGDYWEFTLTRGPALGRDALEGQRVIYDFPRTGSGV